MHFAFCNISYICTRDEYSSRVHVLYSTLHTELFCTLLHLSIYIQGTVHPERLPAAIGKTQTHCNKNKKFKVVFQTNKCNLCFAPNHGRCQMNLIHNLIASTGWFSNTGPTPKYPDGQQVQENPDAMDSIAGKVRKELVCCGYNPEVENLRETEYPHMKGEFSSSY